MSEQKYDLAKLKLGDDGIVTAVQNLEDKNQNNIPAPSNFLKELPVLKTKKIFLSKDSISDSRRIDFNNYVFESEKNNKLEPSSTEPAIKKGALDASVANLQEKSSVGTTGDEFTIPKQLNYFRFFTLDHFTSQFNNNFVNQIIAILHPLQRKLIHLGTLIKTHLFVFDTNEKGFFLQQVLSDPCITK